MSSRDCLADAREQLRHHFGYDEFRPLQARVIGALLEGRDVLAVLPTGGGKSVCFQIPALLHPGPTLVVSPLISLMQDQVAAASARGLPAAALNSSLKPLEQREILTRVSHGEIRLLYTSPERLGRLAAELAALGIRPGRLAVDEAHCISEWGPDFRPAYRTLRRLRAALGWPQCIALTGSATAAVRQDITRVLGLGGARGTQLVLGSFDRRNLWLGVVPVRNDGERFRALLALLRLQDALAIVYAPTRNLVEELARVLGDAGFRAAPYHAGLSPTSRRAVLQRFLADELGVVVATCAFGMGIDKPNVRLVVHWTLPPTPEAYYQEAGRAGRDGGFARCVLLYQPGDAAVPRRQLDVTFPSEQLARDVWAGQVDLQRVPLNLRGSLERLRRELKPERAPPCWEAVRRRREAAEVRIAVMERYARDRRCRRAALLEYFGESVPRCGGCDVCSRGGFERTAHRPRDPLIDRRLSRLRLALVSRDTPWGGCVIEPRVLRRLAEEPPGSESALAAVEGVGPVLARRYSRAILDALGVLARPAPSGGS
jgi:ATP-dependent DNA helicase RecQ